MDGKRELEEHDDRDHLVLPTSGPTPARVPVATSSASSARAPAPSPFRSSIVLDTFALAAQAPPLHRSVAPTPMDEEREIDNLDVLGSTSGPTPPRGASVPVATSSASSARAPALGRNRIVAQALLSSGAVDPTPMDEGRELDNLDVLGSTSAPPLGMPLDEDLNTVVIDNDIATRIPSTTAALGPGHELDNRFLSTDAFPTPPMDERDLMHLLDGAPDPEADSTDIVIEIPGGEELTLCVGPFMSVREIKVSIRARISVPVGVQSLHLKGETETEEMKDQDYILPRSRLALSTTVHVVVVFPNGNGDPHLFDIDCFETVAHLKYRLQQSSDWKLPAASTTLLFEGVEMEDRKRLADFWEVEMDDGTKVADDRLPGSSIGVSAVPKDYPHSTFAERAAASAMRQLIVVNMVMPGAGGNPTPLNVCPTDTVDDMRLQIAIMAVQLQLQPPESYHFRYRDGRMEGRRSIFAYGVKNGDRIDIIPN